MPGVLNDYACAVFVGHDEYWSAGMRDAVDSFVEGGGNVARFAGNFLWQTRIEDEGRTQIASNTSPSRTRWPAPSGRISSPAHGRPPVSRPGALTFGVNGLRGVYSGLGNCVGSGAGGFTIYRPSHWAFDGAGLGYGDVLGATSRIFGYEVDGLDHLFEDGLPKPACTDGAVPEIEILGMGLATNVEADHAVWGETLYIGAADAGFKARALHGAVTAQTLDACTRGNGVIVSGVAARARFSRPPPASGWPG